MLFSNHSQSGYYPALLRNGRSLIRASLDGSRGFKIAMDRQQHPRHDWLGWLLTPLLARPGLCVMILVMLLLKGVSGTAHTLSEQSVAFVGSFLDGGSTEIRAVLRQTAPLAFSVAVIVFAVLRQWLPADARGVFVAALVILGGAWLGNELRYDGKTIAPAFDATQFNGWIGTAISAVSQLGGYLREYKPSLFLASLAVGVYVGWRCQSVLKRIERLFKHTESSPSLKVPRRRLQSSEKRHAA